jgi:hypothetical protein
MDETLLTAVWILTAIVELIVLFAVCRLFTIANTLKEIRDDIRSAMPGRAAPVAPDLRSYEEAQAEPPEKLSFVQKLGGRS